jgi:hypothetical protein
MKRQLLPVFKHSSIVTLSLVLASSIMSPAEAVRLQNSSNRLQEYNARSLQEYNVVSLPKLPSVSIGDALKGKVSYAKSVSDSRNNTPGKALEVPEPNSLLALGLFASIALRFLKTKQSKVT